MKKVLIDLYVPSIMKSYDVRIPEYRTLAHSIDLLNQMLPQLSEGLYSGGEKILCRRSDGEILDPNRTPKEYQLKSGTKLILF